MFNASFIHNSFLFFSGFEAIWQHCPQTLLTSSSASFCPPPPPSPPPWISCRILLPSLSISLAAVLSLRRPSCLSLSSSSSSPDRCSDGMLQALEKRGREWNWCRVESREFPKVWIASRASNVGQNQWFLEHSTFWFRRNPGWWWEMP